MVSVMLIQPSVTEKERERTTGLSSGWYVLLWWMDVSECFTCQTALNWTEGLWSEAALVQITVFPLTHWVTLSILLGHPLPGRVQHSLSSIKAHRWEIAANLYRIKGNCSDAMSLMSLREATHVSGRLAKVDGLALQLYTFISVLTFPHLLIHYNPSSIRNSWIACR